MKYCAPVTTTRVPSPASNIFKQINRCMRSFCASSNNVWIQPWSRRRVLGRMDVLLLPSAVQMYFPW